MSKVKISRARDMASNGIINTGNPLAKVEYKIEMNGFQMYQEIRTGYGWKIALRDLQTMRYNFWRLYLDRQLPPHVRNFR